MIRSINPATGETLWEGQPASQADVDTAVNLAAQAASFWSETPLNEREVLVRNFGKLLEKNAQAIALTISREMGKPLWESKTEVSAMIGKIETSIAAQKERCPEKMTESTLFRACTRHKPLGVCAVFGPYNFPGHLPNGHIVPALLAGNTIVLKPSELTPLVSEKIVLLWKEAGLPEGVVNLVQGDAETGQYLAHHPAINALFFTGSWQTGKILSEQFGSQPDKLLALEMGGNNPLVLGDIEQVDAAAYAIIQSAYLTSGQRCTCARRLIIQKKHRPVIDRLLEWLPKLKIGAYDSTPEPFMGPLVSQAAAEKVLNAQSALLKQGAKALLKSSKITADLPMLSPGILDVTSISDVPDEEIFGPLLQLICTDSFESSIREANRTAYGLAASLLSESQEEYKHFYRSIRAGVINWNRPTTGASSSAPFGGIGQSGNHRPSAYYAADYCSYPVASLESFNFTKTFMPRNPAMTSPAYEVNIDGLVGPTHAYAGLSKGNLASMENAGNISNPKAAALEGLNKMKQMADYGYRQLVLPPHERPHLPTLRALGYTGADNRIPGKVNKDSPELLYQYSSAASMFAANAATATPSIDAADNRLHLTPANKATVPHRMIEAEMTARQLRAMFPSLTFFTIHPPLPIHPLFHDEGAANHIRFCTDPRYVGVHLFVHGQVSQYTPRQMLEAQKAIARSHCLDPSQVVYAMQSTEALNQGVFHNDLISMGCHDLFIYHELAFEDPETVVDELASTFNEICDRPLKTIKVANHEIHLKAAVKTYFFNSQMIKLQDGGFVLFCPKQCQNHRDVNKYLANLLKDPESPIADVHYVDLDHSMRNGGGPACMRFPIVLTDTELEQVNPNMFLTDKLYDRLSKWINTHYRDSLRLEDLADPLLVDETQRALNALTQIFDLGHIYDFQQ